MKTKLFFILPLLACLACNGTSEEKSDSANLNTNKDTIFDQTKWKTKQGMDYPYRDKMLNYLITNDTLKKLNKNEVINLLGEPDRVDKEYLFYTITQESMAFFPLHTKTLVIKLSKDGKVEWRKVHK